MIINKCYRNQMMNNKPYYRITSSTDGVRDFRIEVRNDYPLSEVVKELAYAAVTDQCPTPDPFDVMEFMNKVSDYVMQCILPDYEERVIQESNE